MNGLIQCYLVNFFKAGIPTKKLFDFPSVLHDTIVLFVFSAYELSIGPKKKLFQAAS